jgi:hypothetical protein
MAEIITKALKDLKARQKELQPLVAEYHEIESAIQTFEQNSGGAPTSSRKRSRKAATKGARRGRPRKGEPTRAEQFLALVQEQPGITISEAAKRMSIEPNYLYRVSADLEKQGTIGRDGKGFKPRETAGAATKKRSSA